MLFTLSLVLFAFGNMVPSAAGATFRWDTISVSTPGGILTINPGGSDYALAADLTTIQIRGHGTFGGGVPPTGGGGILIVSCHLPVGSPSGIFEGITATKGYVDYWDRVPPVPGVNANRTQFHVLP